jgi:signal transduction histidine kinase
MDIKIIIKKSLVYSILLTVITLSYFLLIYLTEHILQSMFGYKSLIISMTLATTIGLALDPLRKLIQKIIEKFLFKGSFAEIAEENKLLRQEIIQTEKLKSIATLASGMAHEIKNPLTVLKTFVEYLPKKIDDKAFLEKFTPMVAEEVNRIDNLVHELLDFAKPAIPILKPTHLNNLIDSTLELLSNTALKNKVKITTLYDSDSNTTLNLDYNQMKQALLNIFLNAIDAMPQGGELKIYSLMNSSQIQIKIQDTGIGIDKNDLPHIFDPFYSKKDGGTGLGLSITYEIIKKHGGKIFVESLLKKGTSFIIELPTTHPS